MSTGRRSSSLIKEEIRLIKESKNDLKKFGLTVGTVLLLIGALLFYFTKPSAIYFAGIGGFLILSGLIAPTILKPLNKAWMSLAIVLGFVMTRVILSILYFLILTPIGLIAKVFGKKFLDLKIDKNKTSYWEIREKRSFSPEEYERQF
jgi:hypothetical protein